MLHLNILSALLNELLTKELFINDITQVGARGPEAQIFLTRYMKNSLFSLAKEDGGPKFF